jgi:hypothetical protein
MYRASLYHPLSCRNTSHPELFLSKNHGKSTSVLEHENLLTSSANLARRFKLTREEAARLNITDAIQVRPNKDFGGMLGVKHNLHCLVRLNFLPHYPSHAQKKDKT